MTMATMNTTATVMTLTMMTPTTMLLMMGQRDVVGDVSRRTSQPTASKSPTAASARSAALAGRRQ